MYGQIYRTMGTILFPSFHEKHKKYIVQEQNNTSHII